jgi:hypothetical protein
MKNLIRHIARTVAVACAFACLFSCHYQDIEDAPYPEQTIYMPAAVRGIYDISVEVDTYGVPTPGSPSRFTIDEANSELVVPLSVYRAGVNNEGVFSVGIEAKTDTIATLISSGVLAGAELLPSAEYTFPSSISVQSGSELGTFNLSIDLNFLRSNPGKLFAIAVEISSAERRLNNTYKRTVVLIDSDLAN